MRSRRTFEVVSLWIAGGWVLMVPPLPLGATLPPMSAWSRLAVFEKSDQCEKGREAVRGRAQRIVAGDPNANANDLAGALNAMSATCIEDKTVPAKAAPAPPKPEVSVPPKAGEPAPLKPGESVPPKAKP